ncbi:uncharacterized protein LOC136030050 [Artemia franciscana]|uniref:Thyroglobulin type-1 domain-containing protein n=1 Tax=Artemia franciscana TaxID=6661 RepID=A0AA88H8X1_ARTSF|nr:hypothetical protein QYM36_015972 [Artemia franciscana]
MLAFTFFALLIVICDCAQSDLGIFTCTSEVCTTFNDGNCKIKLCNGFNTTKILHPDVPCDCCEYCIEHLEEGSPCFSTTILVPERMCGPGLACLPDASQEDGYSCQETSTDCTRALDQYNEMLESGSVGIATVKPSCTVDGDYEPKRCLYGLTCYCVGPENNRLTGEVAPADPSSLEMDCECARDYAKAEAAGLLDVGFQRCLPNGNYDPLQCIGDLCFCINPEFEVTDGPIPRSAVDRLKCFNSRYPLADNFEDSNYFSCELEHKKVQEEFDFYANDNIHVLGLDFPECQPDGFYHRIQIRNNQSVCVNIHGVAYSEYAPGAAPDNDDYRCNCARTKELLQEYTTALPVCCANGNFRQWQCMAGKCFCVDPYGEQLTSQTNIFEVDLGDENQLWCYFTGDDDCW